MLAITTRLELIGHWIKMRRFLAGFSEPESSFHTGSLGGLRHYYVRAPVPVLVVATTWVMMRVLRNETHASPFLLALLLLFLGYTGLAISLWPNIIPPAISI